MIKDTLDYIRSLFDECEEHEEQALFTYWVIYTRKSADEPYFPNKYNFTNYIEAKEFASAYYRPEIDYLIAKVVRKV